MPLRKSCVVPAAALTLIAAVFSPSACQAGLFDCFTKPAPAPLTYAPPYQVQMPVCDPCNPCAAPQVNYVPEVKYRWKYSRIERTEYQPVAAADPCTGCPVTTFRPVTSKSLLPWLHREAYTTYKAVPYGGATPVSYMQPTYQPGYCNPCATTCDPCDPCGGSMAAPALGTSSGCSTCVSGMTTYSDSSTDPGYSGQTFSSETGWQSAEPKTETRLKPTPDVETQQPNDTPTNSPTSMPRMLIPQVPTDRTASLNQVRTVSYDAPALMTPSGNLYQAATVAVPLRLVPVE